MKVWVILEYLPGYETSILGVVDSEAKAAAWEASIRAADIENGLTSSLQRAVGWESFDVK